MNLLGNQLTMAGVELRNKRHQEAEKRLSDTEQAYRGNFILHNNLAVAGYLSELSKCNASNSQNPTDTPTEVLSSSILSCFNQAVLMNPVSYIPYYNIFTFYARQNSLPTGFPHLIEAISALHLQKGLKQNDQKLINSVNQSFCSDSVLVYLIRAIVHVKNQKYIIAVSDLMWVIEKVQNIKYIIDLLDFVKMIFKALGEQDKSQSIQKDIDQLITKSTQQSSNDQADPKFRLVSTCQLPSSQQHLKNELSTRLKEFALLIKEKESNSLKSSNTLSQVLFKQINTTDLLKTPLNKSSLLRLLKTSIQESPLYTKSESKVLNRSGQSLYLSINESQELGSGSVQIAPKSQNTKEATSDKKLSHTTIIPKKVEDVISNNSIERSPSKKLNTSLDGSGLNTSGLNNSGLNNSELKKKKKLVNIYPLQQPKQQVEIKLAMAQLTNNKQLLGNMDPYCILTYNGQKKQSKVIKGAGLNPNWKESFFFNLTQNPSELKLSIYDKESFFKKDDFVGSGVYLVDKNGFFKTEIFEGQKKAGYVFFTINDHV